MKEERAGYPAFVRFKFAWSTHIDECDGSDEDCPMKDPRTKWEEAVPDSELQIYYNMGMIQYVFILHYLLKLLEKLSVKLSVLLIAVFRM